LRFSEHGSIATFVGSAFSVHAASSELAHIMGAT
jgi:hypothetical protein